MHKFEINITAREYHVRTNFNRILYNNIVPAFAEPDDGRILAAMRVIFVFSFWALPSQLWSVVQNTGRWRLSLHKLRILTPEGREQGSRKEEENQDN